MQNEAGTVASVTKPPGSGPPSTYERHRGPKTGRVRARRHRRARAQVRQPGPPLPLARPPKRYRRKKPTPKPAVTATTINRQRQPLTQCVRCGTTLPTSAAPPDGPGSTAPQRAGKPPTKTAEPPAQTQFGYSSSTESSPRPSNASSTDPTPAALPHHRASRPGPDPKGPNRPIQTNRIQTDHPRPKNIQGPGHISRLPHPSTRPSRQPPPTKPRHTTGEFSRHGRSRRRPKQSATERLTPCPAAASRRARVGGCLVS